MTKEKINKKSSIVPFILGIIGIILTPILFVPIIGIILGVIGFLLLKKDQINEKIANMALVACLISIIIGVVVYILKLF